MNIGTIGFIVFAVTLFALISSLGYMALTYSGKSEEKKARKKARKKEKKRLKALAAG